MSYSLVVSVFQGQGNIITSFLDDILKRTMLILPYDKRAAEWHAKERANLSPRGIAVPFVDGQIASIARVNGG